MIFNNFKIQKLKLEFKIFFMSQPISNFFLKSKEPKASFSSEKEDISQLPINKKVC